jgi:hypothetical protein
MHRLSVDIEKLSAAIGAVDLRPAGRRLATHEAHRLRLHAPLHVSQRTRVAAQIPSSPSLFPVPSSHFVFLIAPITHVRALRSS